MVQHSIPLQHSSEKNDSSKRKPVLVAVGLYRPGTGFTRVLTTLFKSLSKSFSIHWLGIAYKGPVSALPHFTLHPNNVHGGDIFGNYRAASLAAEVNADIVLFLNDVWMLKNYRDTHKDTPWKKVAYIPLDGQITNPHQVEDLTFLDAVIAYHDEAQTQFDQAFSALRSTSDTDMPSLHAISHGVDTDVFHTPAPDTNLSWRKPFTRAFFEYLPDWEESLFILNANRINERKDLEATIKGFALAAESSERSLYLCLHQPGAEEFQLKQLREWALETTMHDRILIHPFANKGYLDDTTLSDLYKACHIGINTTLGEGWGMISFEHAACGAAQIIPDHAGLKSIWGDAAAYINTTETVLLPTNPFAMRKSRAEDVSRAILTLTSDPALLAQKSRAAWTHAHDPAFQWEQIGERWGRVLLMVGDGITSGF